MAEERIEDPIQSGRRSVTAIRTFSATAFLSAFLLFMIQPITGKSLLPFFGGVSSVWSVSMLFYQSVFLLACLYAHLTTRSVNVRTERKIHLACLTLAILLLPAWTPLPRRTPDVSPSIAVLEILALRVGFPVFVLGSTTSLLQRWFSNSRNGPSPYRLYAWSNAGSLLGLMSFPLLFERALTGTQQKELWSAAFVIYAGLIVACRRLSFQPSIGQPSSPLERLEDTPNARAVVLWIALSACGSILLLAVTNAICEDLVVFPLLWVVPLAVYLVTLIVCFSERRIYSRIVFFSATVTSSIVLIWVQHTLEKKTPAPSIVLYLILLFCSCMMCHGELASLKPAPAHVTSFYLACAAGGALGGVVVGVIAPLAFSDYLELPFAIQAVGLLVLAVVFRESGWRVISNRPSPAIACSLLIGLGFTSIFLTEMQFSYSRMLLRVRNFYGVIRVQDDDEKRRRLLHGRVEHGYQFLSFERRGEATAYFGRDSGVALAILHHQAQARIKVGIIGLGAGTLAAYGRPGDVYRFYELNPAVIDVASRLFTYLSDSGAEIQIVPGDGRISLEHEPSQGFDLLVNDAFRGASIPVHLLTVEAFETYLRHLKPQGTLVLNLTNAHLDLEGVVMSQARRFRLEAVFIRSTGDAMLGTYACTYALLSKNLAWTARSVMVLGGQQNADWRDDYSDPLGIVKWW